MSDDPRPTIRNNPPRLTALWIQVLCGVLLALIGAVQVGLQLTLLTDFSGILIGLNSLLVACGVAQAALAAWNIHVWGAGQVRLRPDGIVLRELRERLVPWHDIADVQPVRRSRALVVVLTLKNGRKVRLPAPITRDRVRDPQFVPHLNTIHRWWQHHR